MARFEIRSAPQFHEISSEMVSFQIRSAPQFHQFSSKIAHFQIRNFVRNGQISNKERGVPCRVVPCRSPIRFFDPILNKNARMAASLPRYEKSRWGGLGGPGRNCHLQWNLSVVAECVQERREGFVDFECTTYRENLEYAQLEKDLNLSD